MEFYERDELPDRGCHVFKLAPSEGTGCRTAIQIMKDNILLGKPDGTLSVAIHLLHYSAGV